MVKIRAKIWMENEDGDKIFGDGPQQLLEGVDRLGSLKKAAESIDMSYAQAWHIIKMVEDNLNTTLLETQVGGRSGGGSRLTPEGQQMVNSYRKFREQSELCMSQSYNKNFKDLDV